MKSEYIYLAIMVMAVANFLTRVLPFLFFKKHNPPKFILFIEDNFPPIIMTILIIYSLSNVKFSVFPYGLKELTAVFVTAFLHFKYGNFLISIFVGTIFYMILVQFVV